MSDTTSGDEQQPFLRKRMTQSVGLVLIGTAAFMLGMPGCDDRGSTNTDAGYGSYDPNGDPNSYAGGGGGSSSTRPARGSSTSHNYYSGRRTSSYWWSSGSHSGSSSSSSGSHSSSSSSSSSHTSRGGFGSTGAHVAS